MTTSLLPTKPISLSLPRNLPTWYIFPSRSIKRSPEPKRRKEPENQIGGMDDADIDEPPLPIPTGPEHWEEQRRKWTANDVSRTERQKRIQDDVHPTLREVTQHSR